MRNRFHALLLAVFALLLTAPDARAQTFEDWEPGYTLRGLDGPVYVAKEGPDGNIYVGGAFVNVDGRYEPGVVRWNTALDRWEPLAGITTGFSGSTLRGASVGENFVVHDLDWLPDGRLVLGGRLGINTSNGWKTYGVVIYDGAGWSAAGGSPSDAAIENGTTVYAVQVIGTDIIVGGDFDTTRRYNVDKPMRGIARIDVAGGVWTAFGDESSAATNGVGADGGAGTVRDLLLDDDGSIVVAGEFDQVGASGGAQPISGVARWTPSASAWSAFGSATSGQNGADAVYQVLKSGTDYFARVGGSAYQSDGSVVSAGTALRWDGSAWQTLGAARPGGATAGYNGVDTATGLFLDDSGAPVYVGATRAFDGGTTGVETRGFARWTGSTWAPHFPSGTGVQVYAEEHSDGMGAAMSGHETAVVVGSDTYAFGPFYSVTDGTITESVARAAKWDGARWTTLGSAQSGGIASSGNVLRAATLGGDIYLVGQLTRAGLEYATGFARYNVAAGTWEALPEITGARGIIAWNGKLVIWGDFTSVQASDGRTIFAQHIVAFDPAARTWEAFGDGSSASRNGLSNAPNDLAAAPDGNLIVVGSDALQNDGSELGLPDIGVWNVVAGAWQPLEPSGVAGEAHSGSFGGNANVTYDAVAVGAGGQIYVAGQFRSIAQADGTFLDVHGIAQWDGARWQSVGGGIPYLSSNRFHDVEVIGGEVVLAGRYSAFSGNNVSRWDGTAWSNLGTSSYAAYDIVFHGGDALVRYGDHFGYCGETNCRSIGRTSPTLASEFKGGGASVEALAVVDDRLFVIGTFTQVKGTPSQGVAEHELDAPTRQPRLAITAPGSGALGVASSPTIRWTALPGASAYDVQLASGGDFSSPQSQRVGTPSAAFVGLAAGTEYAARVRAVTGGQEGPWSAPSVFTTAYDTAPSVVTLVAPGDGSTSEPLDPALSWDAAERAETYDLQVATDAGFGSLVVDLTGLTSTQTGVSGLAIATTYYWRARAVNGAGTGAWSAARTFATADADYDPPSYFTFNATSATHNTGSASFVPIPNANVQIARDAAFTDLVIDSTYTPANLYFNTMNFPERLTAGTQFWGRVRGIGAAGERGPWSAVTMITTPGLNPNAPSGFVTLTAPANNSTDQPLTPTFEWDPSTVTGTATSYDLQVSSNRFNFTGSNLRADVTGLTGTAHTLAEPLPANTTLHWRMRPVNGSFAGNWGGTRQFRTDGGTGGGGGGGGSTPPTLVSPSDLEGDIPELATVVWNTVEGAAQYQVQIAPSYAFSASNTVSEVTSDTTFTTLLDRGTGYHWRVRVFESPVVWSEVRRFGLTSAPQPDGPAFLAPSVSGGDIYFNGDIFAKQPYITWEPVEGATHYELGGDVTSGSGGSTIEPWYTSGSPFFGSIGTDVIQVRAVTPTGRTRWSFWNYRVEDVDDVTPLPSDGVTHGSREVPRNPRLYWDGAGHPRSDIQIATDPAFSNVVFSADGTRHVAQVTGLAASTKHYWRLRADASSRWSSTLVFSTGDGVPTDTVALLSPAPGAENVDARAVFRFEPTMQAERYRVQISSGSDFSATVLDTLVTGTEFRPNRALAFQATYRWRAQAVATSGGPWSDARTFTTRTPPPIAPTLLRPSAGATDQPILVTLQWSRPLGTTSFQYEVASDAAFSNVVQSGTVSDPRASLDPLMPGTTVHVRLRAHSARDGVFSPWSAGQSFTVRTLPALAAPTLTGPADAAPAVDLLPVLSWDAVPDAARYEVVFGRDAAFTDSDITRTEALSRTIFDSPTGTAFYWRVRALPTERAPAPDTSSIGAGPWSPTRSFTTGFGPAPTDAPVLNQPLVSGGVSRLPEFRWSPVTAATAYYVQVSAQPDMSSPILYELTPLDGSTSYTLTTPLDGGATYYVRVQAVNYAGQGPWSTTYEIRTAVGDVPTAQARLTRPTQDATVPTSARFAWTGSETVDLEISEAADFSGTGNIRPNRTGYQDNVSGLRAATRYFARVRAKTAGGTGPWSAAVRFETLPTPSAQASVATGDPDPVVLEGTGVEVDFSNLSGPNPLVSVEQFNSAPPGGFAVGGFTLQGATFWTVSIEGADSFTSDVCFDLSAAGSVPGGAPALVIYKREAEGAPWVELTTELRPAGTPTQICALGVTSFSDFVLAANDALPVELIGFDAAQTEGAVLLRWTTATETNNAGFAIERLAVGSSGGGLWEEIGWQAGAGSSVEAQNYTFLDEALPYDARALHYRLRQVDYDGAVEYSPEVEVESETPLALALEANFPNPFGSSTTVRFAIPKAGDVRIAVYDVLGREVMRLVDEPRDAGRYEVTLDARSLATGVYLYRIQAGGKSVVRQMTVVR